MIYIDQFRWMTQLHGTVKPFDLQGYIAPAAMYDLRHTAQAWQRFLQTLSR